MKAFLALVLIAAAVGAACFYYPTYRPFLPASVANIQLPGMTPVPEFVPPDPLPKKADWTWTTTTGQTYHNVQIVKVEADCVTILHSNGGARIDTSTLPPDLQKQLNYNPVTAQQAAAQRSEDEAHDKEQMTQESVAIQSNAMNNPTPPLNTAPVATDPRAALAYELNVDQAHYNDCIAQADAAQKAYDAETISKAFGTDRPPVSKDAQGYRDLAAEWQKKIVSLKAQLTAAQAQAAVPGAAGK